MNSDYKKFNLEGSDFKELSDNQLIIQLEWSRLLIQDYEHKSYIQFPQKIDKIQYLALVGWQTKAKEELKRRNRTKTIEFIKKIFFKMKKGLTNE